MTFGQLARLQVSADRYQHKNYQAKMPNGSVPGPGYVNPYALPGMDITGMKASDFKTIPVSKEYEQKVKDLAFRELRDGYGMTSSNELANIVTSYYPQVPVEDRVHAARTLDKIHRAEAYRLVEFVQSKIPGWQVGQAFDTSILEEYKQGIDTHA